MKTCRFSLAVLLLIALVSLSGCNKTWSFDFTETTDISDWNQDAAGGTLRSLDANGLVLDGLAISTPMSFTGNVTATIEFALDTDSSDTLYLQFAFTDDPSYSAMDNYLMIWMDYVGAVGSEAFQVEDYNESTGSSIVTSLSNGNISPYLNRSGDNTFVMKKKNSEFEFYINGEFLDGGNMEHFNSQDCYIRLSSELSRGGTVYFKRISVVYTGKTSL